MDAPHLAISIGLAVGAAGSFAVSNVLQAQAVRRRKSPAGVDLGILSKLARQPLWLAGLGAAVVGFGLQAVALGIAPVVVVQPLIVSELLFALPLAAFTNGVRLRAREWTGAAMVTVGLVLLVAVIHPSDPHFHATAPAWGILGGLLAGLAALLVVVAGRVQGVARTSALAAAAAVTVGMMSVLTKTAADDFAHRGIGALGTWPPYAVAVVGIAGMSLVQNAFSAGPLAVSLPLIDVGEPLVASVVAVTVFGERLGHLSPLATGVLIFAAVLAVTGVVSLDRSPLVRSVQAEFSEQQPGEAAATDGEITFSRSP